VDKGEEAVYHIIYYSRRYKGKSFVKQLSKIIDFTRIGIGGICSHLFALKGFIISVINIFYYTHYHL